MSDFTATIRKLLDKAQATEFTAEAEAFFAKAQDLMARHGIEEAAVRAVGSVQSDEVVQRTFNFQAPYAYGKMMLAWLIHDQYGLQGVRTQSGKTQCLSFFGTKSNLDNFETMTVALQLHATGEMLKAKKPEWENARSFRASFLEGYGSRIAQVLREANRTATAAATQNLSEHEVKGVGLVLLDEKIRVKQAFKSRYPHVRKGGRSQGSSGSGRSAGSAAASRFTGHQSNLGGSRKALV